MVQNDNDNESIYTNNTLGFDKDFFFENGITVGAGVALDWIRFLSQDPCTTLGSILSADMSAMVIATTREGFRSGTRSTLSASESKL